MGGICGLSLLLVLFSARKVFLRVFRLSLLKNQHFQVPILDWKVSPIYLLLLLFIKIIIIIII